MFKVGTTFGRFENPALEGVVPDSESSANLTCSNGACATQFAICYLRAVPATLLRYFIAGGETLQGPKEWQNSP